MLARDEDRSDRAAVVRRAADRIRRHRARRRAPRRRPRRARARRHAVRERRLAHQGNARLAACSTRRIRRCSATCGSTRIHAAASYLDIADDFDVVHDHSGIIGPAHGRAARADRPPVVHTLHGPWTEPVAPLYALLADHVHLVAISDAQRADNPDIQYAGVVHNGIDLDGYPFRRGQGRLPRLHRARRTPTRGPTLAIEVARRAGPPARDGREEATSRSSARTGTRSSRRCSTTRSRSTRRSPTSRRSTCSAGRGRWCSRSSGPSRSGW